MKLLILGASGATGRWLVRLAAQAGHDVTALVRPSTPFDAPAGVRVVRGDVLDSAIIATAVEHKDAVASCLGIRRGGRSPWAPLQSPADFTTRATSSVIAAMSRAGVRRLVALSAGGVAESITQLSMPVRWLVGTGNVGVAYRDLAEMERLLSASLLDWLAVRPVTLMSGPPTGRVGKVEKYGLFSIVRRTDVAAWMLGALARPTPYVEQTVLLGTIWGRG